MPRKPTAPGGQVKVGAQLYVLPSPEAPRSDRVAREQRQAIYLAWIIQPKDEREPRTKTEMASQLGVTIQTLLAYERDPDFAAAVREKLGQAFKVDRLPALFESLYTTATDPENPRQVQAARTLLEWFGRSQDQQGHGLAELSVEELEALAAQG